MQKRYARALSGVAVLSIVAAACGSSSSNTTPKSTKAPTATPVTKTGGVLTIGAEQEPDCFDWIGSCAGSAWGVWMAQNATVPNAFIPERQPDGSYKNVPGPVLAGMPTVATTPVETITYTINPKAVWSDGVPITCADFAYTWDQIAHGTKIYDTTGYTDIAKVDCSDPSKAVVSYKKGTSFATWQQLFGGGYGILPSHILKNGDRDKEMKNGYTWSGGPWFASWTRGDNITLTPNPKYWGDKPKLDKVVFKIQKNTAAEVDAFTSNQVQAIYPAPTTDLLDAMGNGISGANQDVETSTGSVEAVWFNVQHAPLNDPVVRRALAYSIDRDSIVSQLFGKLGVKKAWNSLNAGINADYSDQNAFSKYHLDLTQASKLMTDDGWTKGAGGIWTKNGKQAAFTLSTNSDNKGRVLMVNALVKELAQAGFAVRPAFRTADQFFGPDLSTGAFDAGIFANSLTSFTPGLCSILCTKSIPTTKNGNSGNNADRYSNVNVDKQLELVDSSLDPAVQMQAAKTADDLLAQDVPALPLDPLPDVLLWSKRIVGPVSDNAVLGMFWNLNEWGCQDGKCT